MTPFFTVGVSKKVIFDKISLFSSYLAGKRSEDYVAYDRVAIHDLDIPLLDYISDEVAVELASKMGNRVKNFEIDGDLIRFTLVNPAYEAMQSGVQMEMPDSGLLLGLMESYIEASTIFRWLQIAGYEFGAGASQAAAASAEVASGKLALLINSLTPCKSEPPAEFIPSIKKARPRRVSPL